MRGSGWSLALNTFRVSAFATRSLLALMPGVSGSFRVWGVAMLQPEPQIQKLVAVNCDQLAVQPVSLPTSMSLNHRKPE